MKVLLYDNRKIDPIVIDASTEEAELAAFMALFKYLKDEWHSYYYLDNVAETAASDIRAQSALYKKACGGCAKSARQLLKSRVSYEYEEWCFRNVINPLEPDQLPLR